jgi:hypothetical protein
MESESSRYGILSAVLLVEVGSRKESEKVALELRRLLTDLMVHFFIIIC